MLLVGGHVDALAALAAGALLHVEAEVRAGRGHERLDVLEVRLDAEKERLQMGERTGRAEGSGGGEATSEGGGGAERSGAGSGVARCSVGVGGSPAMWAADRPGPPSRA